MENNREAKEKKGQPEPLSGSHKVKTVTIHAKNIMRIMICNTKSAH